MEYLTLPQLIRLSTALSLANGTWPNDPDTIELLRIVNDAISDKMGIKKGKQNEE